MEMPTRTAGLTLNVMTLQGVTATLDLQKMKSGD